MTTVCAPVAGFSALIAIILVALYNGDGFWRKTLFEGVFEHPFAAQVLPPDSFDMIH